MDSASPSKGEAQDKVSSSQMQWQDAARERSQQLWALSVGAHLRIFGRIRCECSDRICGPQDAVTRPRPNPNTISAEAHLQ